MEANKTLDNLLDDWTVISPGQFEMQDELTDWYAVADSDGIIAYFSTEADACRFRLAEINRALNG